MKNQLVKVLMLMLLLAHIARAIEFKDFIGSWSGKHKETQNGVGFSDNALIEGKHRSDGGLLLIERVDSSLLGPYTARLNFHKSGKFARSSTTSSGFIISSSSGNWKKANGRISVSGKHENLNGTSKFTGTLYLISKNKMQMSVNNDGIKVVTTANRR